MNIFRKIWFKRWMLRSLLTTIRFNFHYLPFKQAIFLPVVLYKCKNIKGFKGKVRLEVSNPLKFGMITLGEPIVSIYPNSGIIYENHGGTIVFKGSCVIGNNSAISIGPHGTVTFGDKFCASSTLRLICYNNITFKDKVRIGWECTFMDTDFHKMRKLNGGYTKGYGNIKIGKGCWFANRCVVLKNAQTAEYNTFSTGSVVNSDYGIPYAVYGTSNIVLKREGIYRDIDDDKIDYKQ